MLRDRVFKSHWQEDLNSNDKLRKRISAYLDALTENEAGALLRLDSFVENVTVDLKGVRQVKNATDPEKLEILQPGEGEDLGSIEYQIPPPDIADIVWLLADSESVNEFISARTKTRYGYWSQIMNLINYLLNLV